VIDCEEDRLLRPVLVGMLREAERVSDRWHGRVRTQIRRDERRRSCMDNSSGMQRHDGWTWKVWVGIVVGLAVVAVLIILIANAGGGSGGGSGGIY
jgi:hypothetical protein